MRGFAISRVSVWRDQCSPRISFGLLYRRALSGIKPRGCIRLDVGPLRRRQSCFVNGSRGFVPRTSPGRRIVRSGGID